MLEVFEIVSLIVSIISLILTPIAILVFFVFSLRRYILAKKEAKNAPQKTQDYSLMTSLVYLIVSSVLVAFVLLIAWWAILLISGDISFM